MFTTRRRFLAGTTAALASPAAVETAAEAIVPAKGPAAPTAAPSPARLALVAQQDGDALVYTADRHPPVIRLRPGQSLDVSLANHLAEPTDLVWDGLRGAQGFGTGSPTAEPEDLAPGGTRRGTLAPPDSGTLWFHPAARPGRRDQESAGLRGVVVVEEAEPPLADRDIVLLLGDAGEGFSVNGLAEPLRDTVVPGGRCRLRVVNGAPARILLLAVEGASPRVIAIDSQPSDLFTPVRNSVPAGPGARYELMLDAPREPGALVRLTARAVGAKTGEGPPPAASDILILTTGPGAARTPLPPIAALPRNPALPPAIPLERAVRATLVIEAAKGAVPPAPRWRLNGAASLALPKAPLLTAPRGSAVVLGLDNRSQEAVPLHLPGQCMRLLHAKDDGWEPYWRDSVILPPASVAHVAFMAEAPGDWPIVSAAFPQAAAGLRYWFRIAG